jgi:hypothetical protein
MFVGAKFISPALLKHLILKGLHYVCRGEIHFARSPSTSSSSTVSTHIVGRLLQNLKFS